ncbi:hypothetical protein [Herbaspirillum rubrisubalbicans]|uniref:hypothetical protein n=1 Tax=Herbaspirillum rubrisubalbicans TaxID=80842 RepID=UPI0012FE5FF8|nr:hypothetical protein [Herbaspirillum rubrisubalbicans]
MRLPPNDQGFKIRGGGRSEIKFALVFITAITASWWPDILSERAKSVIEALAHELLGVFVSGQLLWKEISGWGGFVRGFRWPMRCQKYTNRYFLYNIV